ncbi:hypothetical protein [Vreelandella lutescens]|uniref:Uncharacterized protein n=1 Tax=Vreelandella lutescens TaxID=1602943 RepID=A0ABQ1NSQ3_9GAMM|nr:hypothetical protein [Halomonas lutescens]GGC83950.1 hypothetical protein GCM10011382_12650 [Halomonas lutescens]
MLDLFTEIVDKKKLHPKFKLVKDHLSLSGEHDILKDWIEGFIDRDNKIIQDFQENFHSAFWEFYLFAVFKEAGFEIDFKKNRPDFRIIKPKKIYVEATVANIKDKGPKEDTRTFDDIMSMIKPAHMQKDFDDNLRESITRYSGSILAKSNMYTGYTKKTKKIKDGIEIEVEKKYNGYSEDEDFDLTAPYIIALSGYEQINYGNNFFYAMFALLYGSYYNNLNDNFSKKENIVKPDSSSTIPIGLFLDNNMEHVSAIIFSCTMTLGKLTSLSISQQKSHFITNSVLCIRHDTTPPHFKPQIVSPDSPEYLSDGLFIFHNPFAKNPVDSDAFNKTNIVNVHFDIERNTKTFEGNNLPIASRLNLFGGKQQFENLIYKIIKHFNPDLVFVSAKVVDIMKLTDDEKSFEVTFKDIDSETEFNVSFTDKAIKEQRVKENEKYLITYSLRTNAEIKTIDQFKLNQRFKKIRCLEFGEGTMIDIKKLTQDN